MRVHLVRFVIATVGVFVCDQLTKAAALRWVPSSPGGGRSSAICLRVIWNRRPVAMHRAAAGVWLLVWAAVAATLALVSSLPGLPVAGSTGFALACGTAVGGAAGNLADFTRHGGVVDFVHLGRYPPFNLADVAMVCGAVTAAVLWWS